MDWDAIGAVGEVVGAVAVLLTLIYLGYQMRQTRQIALMQIYQNRAETLRQHWLEYADSEHLAPIYEKVRRAMQSHPEDLRAALRSGLTDEERTRYGMANRALMIYNENMFFQRSHGMVDDEYMESNWLALIRNAGPIWQALGFLEGGHVRESYREEVLRILADNDN